MAIYWYHIVFLDGLIQMLIMKLFCQGKYKLNTIHINDSQIASIF